MDNKLDHIISKIDKIEDTQVKQEINLSRLTQSVEEHVKRTNQLEAIVLPIQRKFNYLEGVLKFMGFLGVLAAIVEALWKRP